MVVEGAKKGFEKASEKVETKNTKDLLDTGKAAAEAVKEKVDKKEKWRNKIYNAFICTLFCYLHFKY